MNCMSEHEPSLMRSEHLKHMREAAKHGFITVFAQDIHHNWLVVLNHKLLPEHIALESAREIGKIFDKNKENMVGFTSLGEMVEAAETYWEGYQEQLKRQEAHGAL